jgi:hypothetical protein
MVVNLFSIVVEKCESMIPTLRHVGCYIWKLEPSMYCIVGLCNLNLRPLCVNRDLVSAVVESALL